MRRSTAVSMPVPRLAEARTRTFSWRSKTFLASTPTIQGISRIERDFLVSRGWIGIDLVEEQVTRRHRAQPHRAVGAGDDEQPRWKTKPRRRPRRPSVASRMACWALNVAR